MKMELFKLIWKKKLIVNGLKILREDIDIFKFLEEYMEIVF